MEYLDPHPERLGDISDDSRKKMRHSGNNFLKNPNHLYSTLVP